MPDEPMANPEIAVFQAAGDLCYHIALAGTWISLLGGNA
jgi:hypothetical protein